jgi:hypothetical protein
MNWDWIKTLCFNVLLGRANGDKLSLSLRCETKSHSCALLNSLSDLAQRGFVAIEKTTQVSVFVIPG